MLFQEQLIQLPIWLFSTQSLYIIGEEELIAIALGSQPDEGYLK